jgi:predicted RNA-binding protein
MAFHRAGAEAIKAALAEGGTQLLEPVMAVTVHSPSASVGDVVGDLNRRHGRIARIDDQDGRAEVSGFAPLAQLVGYTTSLRSLSQGGQQRGAPAWLRAGALHEEGEGARSRAPFCGSGSASMHGVDLPGDRVASSALDPRHAWMGPAMRFCIAMQQNCRKSWIKVMPHDKLRTPLLAAARTFSCVMTKTPEPWS